MTLHKEANFTCKNLICFGKIHFILWTFEAKYMQLGLPRDQWSQGNQKSCSGQKRNMWKKKPFPPPVKCFGSFGLYKISNPWKFLSIKCWQPNTTHPGVWLWLKTPENSLWKCWTSSAFIPKLQIYGKSMIRWKWEGEEKRWSKRDECSDLCSGLKPFISHRWVSEYRAGSLPPNSFILQLHCNQYLYLMERMYFSLIGYTLWLEHRQKELPSFSNLQLQKKRGDHFWGPGFESL